jgi:CelD/BcsL family acetyltransferase involved in cellulose biosynthesis
LKIWWQSFGTKAEKYLCSVKEGSSLIGISPLMLADKTAYILGSPDICDYVDFVIQPGKEYSFFNKILDDLVKKGVRELNLGPLRPDSTAFMHLLKISKQRKHHVTNEKEDVSVEFELPSTWNEYLGRLKGKQRHEVRRKLRRLHETGTISYQTFDNKIALEEQLDLFLHFFKESRDDKNIFMTSDREAFFRSLTKAMAAEGLLRIGVLKLNSRPVAAVLCFNYRDILYLYNSGYDPAYRHLSVGLISKVLCIKESIKRGKKRFDFLKGAEAYKFRMGGKEIPLYRSRIVLAQSER